MRPKLLIAAASLFLAVSFTAVLPYVFGQRQADAGKQPPLAELLKQRRDTLAKAVEILTFHIQQGNLGFEELLTAQQQLMEAELEASTTRNERMAILERARTTAEAALTIAEKKFETGSSTQLDALFARAALLAVEIRLLREREVENPKRK